MSNGEHCQSPYAHAPLDYAGTRRSLDEARAEVDRLLDWSNSIAARMGDNFDGDEGQEYIIDRWLDLIQARLAERDPAGYAWLFESGPDPREDEEPVTR